MYLVTIIFILLPLVIAALVWLWVLLAKQAKDDVHLSKAQDLLSKSRRRSTELISEATKKSKKIIENTEFFAQEAQQDLDQALKQGIDRITEKNEEHIEKLMHHYDQVANQVNEEAKAMAEEKITSFAGEVHNQIKTTTDKMDNMVAQELQQIKNNLATFEKEKKAELEADMRQQVGNLVKEITGKAIPTAEHERLIKEALAKAKLEVWS